MLLAPSPQESSSIQDRNPFSHSCTVCPTETDVYTTGSSIAIACTLYMIGVAVVVVSVETKMSFVEPGHRWAHSPSSSGAPGIPYQGTMKTSVRMLRTSGGL